MSRPSSTVESAAGAGETPFRARLDRIRNLLAHRHLDAAVFTSGEDLLYLIGSRLDSHERLTALVVSANPETEPVLVIPALEVTDSSIRSANEVGARLHSWLDGTDPVAELAALLHGTVAVSDSMRALHLLPLQAHLRQPLVSAGSVIDPLRSIKSEWEISQLAEAARRIDNVHARMADFLLIGRTEREVGDAIAAAIVEEGLDHPEFVIVGSGPNGADPHHEVSDRRIEPGDVVVVDIGGPLTSGYHSDCTRTYVVGAPSEETATEYAHLEEAQRRAREAVRPGVRIGTIDHAARSYLESVGLGERFTHRTGHGIGLGLHEPPFVAPGADTVLREGMTFSVEPGIYLCGRWGARLEDIVVVTATGCRSLNTGPRGLRSI